MQPDILIPKDRYTKVRGKLYFFSPNDLNAQCASCLNVQQRSFVRAENGIIIGLELKPEGESHADDCPQK